MTLGIAGILLLAGLGASAAQAAEHEFGGKISLGVGVKPEFVETDGDGKYALVTGKATMLTDKTWAASLEESLKAVEHPEKEAALEDPILRLGYLGNPLEGTGLKLTLGLAATPGLSLASREEDYYGAVKPSAAVSRVTGGAEVGVGASVTRHFRRYTRTPEGKASVELGAAASLFGGYDFGNGLSVSVSVAYREAVPYEGPSRYGYLNELAVEYAVTAAVTLEASLSTSDTQQAADGSEINEFSLYRQNKTEMYLGASYAL